MNPRPTHQVRLEVEQLEDRQLLAGHIVSGPPALLERLPTVHHALTAKAASMSADEKLIVDYTNEFRRGKGHKNLRVNRQLVLAAQRHASRLIACNCLGDRGNPHVLNGKTVSDRVKAAGYPFAVVGENIAFNLIPFFAQGETTDIARQMVDGWISSTGHRKNMLFPRFTEIGVGLASVTENGNQFYFGVQVFGRR